MRMFTDHNVKNTFVIDKSNGYPVVVTTNVTKDTPWKEVFKKNSSLKKIFLDWGDDNWRPSNWKGPCGDYSCEEYKNVFLQLRYHSHIDDYESYLEVLNRFELRYDKDKDLHQLIDKYIDLKNWKKMSTYFTYNESNDLEKIFIKIENELINIFNRI